MWNAIRSNNSSLKVFSSILILIFLLSNFVGVVQAQEGLPKESASISMLDSTPRTVEILINYTLEREVNDYNLQIKYPDYLLFKDFNEGSVNCPPEIITVENNELSLSCSLGPYQSLDRIGSVASVVFQIEGDGNEQISFSTAEFGEMEVNTSGVFIESNIANSSSYIFSDFTVEDAILWLGAICLVGIGIALYVHFSGKKGKRRNDQLVFASLLVVIAVSGISAVVLAMGVGNYDTREEASVKTCAASCSDKVCGSDGCGGTCGICDVGFSCTANGDCEWDSKEEIYGELDYCETNYDCIKVDSGCCPCSSGGEEKAINREMMEENKELMDCDFGFACPSVYNCTDSFAVCKNNRCELGFDGVLGASTTDQSIVDLNNDGLVTIEDYAIFLNDYQNWQYHKYLEGRSDLNEDGEISTFDYLIFIEEYFEK